ncbi:MAG: flagellar basal body-associated FliL family protein [Myxococcota bacterium]|nr:flagellar basal body-associated FliL family protein [Myxococcota bacterium]
MAEETQNEDVEQPKKSKTMLIVIIVVGANLAIIGVVLALTLGGSKSAEAEAAPNPQTAAPVQTGLGPLVKLDSFIVNVASEEGTQYLKASLVIELTGEHVNDLFSKSEMIVRNEVLMYLSSLSVQNTQTVKQKRAIQSRLTKLINKRLEGEIVKGAFFTEFVTQ